MPNIRKKGQLKHFFHVKNMKMEKTAATNDSKDLTVFHIFSYNLLHSDVWSALLLEVGQHE